MDPSVAFQFGPHVCFVNGCSGSSQEAHSPLCLLLTELMLCTGLAALRGWTGAVGHGCLPTWLQAQRRDKEPAADAQDGAPRAPGAQPGSCKDLQSRLGPGK